MIARAAFVPATVGVIAVVTGTSVGCGDERSPSSETAPHVDAAAAPVDAGADVSAREAAADPDPDGPGLHGTVVDESGKPLGDHSVTLCSASVCQFTTSGPTGRFVFPVPATGTQFLLKTQEDFASMPARGSAILPVHLSGEERLDLGELFVPALPTIVPLGPTADDPQTLQVGDGLELTLRRADLLGPLGGRDDIVAARALPLERATALAKLGVPEPIGAFALSPHGMTSSSKMRVRLPTTLAAGTQVKLYTIGDLDGALSAPIVAVSDGSKLATAAGEGITELTWLILSK